MKRSLLNIRGKRQGKSVTSTKLAHPKKLMEQLELRRMLSVTYDAATYTISLYGTAGNDSYTVSMISPTITQGARLRVTEGVAIYQFPTATHLVTKVSAHLLAGADTLTLASTLQIKLDARGGDDADTISGAQLNDSIDGEDGSDSITGNGGDDTLNGWSGRDTIRGNDGDDSITGGFENDTLYGDNGEDTISGGDDSDDRIYGGTENDLIKGDQGNDTINGNDGNDTIAGGDGSDHLSGDLGDDSIIGNGHNDTLNGNDGNDTLYGNNGSDSLSGHAGDDSIFGDAHNDTLNGHAGNDTLMGGTENDYLDGGENKDSLLGEAGNDRMWGRQNNDTLDGGSGNDSLRGEDGVDSILGGSENDDADGGSGNDILDGDTGIDTVRGGSNDDLVRGGSDNDLVYGDGGNDSVYGGTGTDTLYGGGGRDGLFGGSEGLEDSVYGNAGNDRFLNKYTGGSAVGQNWEDHINDKANDEARIGFKDADADTFAFGGTIGTFDYAAGVWSDTEIEQTDVALGILHNATANKELLEKPGGNEIEMLMHGAVTHAHDGTTSPKGMNDGGQVHIFTFSHHTILHEIGHYWDKEYDKDGWRAISGWVKNPADTTGLTQGLDDSDDWWFGSSAQFCSDYATTNPEEDFAESFANYFMNLGGLDFVVATGWLNINTIEAKESFFDSMVTDLS